MEGGDNRYRYVDADPVNLSDPTGECPMCVAYAVCVAECMLEDAAVNAVTGECNNFGQSAKSCALSCVIGPLGDLVKWAGRARKAARRAEHLEEAVCNSFPAETLVQVKPKNANVQDAKLAKATLKPIGELHVGDDVLAQSEWKAKGPIAKMDQRLSYEKITDIFTSDKQQTLVHLKLNDGQELTATDGHPFKTPEGWRDAILLKKGGQLLLKGGEGDVEHTSTIVDLRTEKKVLPVFNLEVANAHTYFVGVDGELVHNGACNWNRTGRKHVQDRHVGNKPGWEHKTKYKNPKRIEKDANKTVSSSDRVDRQNNGNTRYEKDFNRDIGTNGERTNVVVTDGKGNVVTSFPTN